MCLWLGPTYPLVLIYRPELAEVRNSTTELTSFSIAIVWASSVPVVFFLLFVFFIVVFSPLYFLLLFNISPIQYTIY